MTNILDEVLNDEKDQKRLGLFRKFFPIIVTGSIIIAIVIGVYNWYLAHKAEKNRELGDVIMKLVTENKSPEVVKSILQDILTQKENNGMNLAALKLLDLELQSKNLDAAFGFIDQIIKSDSYDEITTAYARIAYINLVLDNEKLNAEQQNKIREYLQFFHKETQVFYSTATLLKALFYFKQGELELSKQYANEVLSLKRASATQKQQASFILNSILKLPKTKQ